MEQEQGQQQQAQPGGQPQEQAPVGAAGPPPSQGSPLRPRRGYRSLFWAVVLIGAGVVWLLFSLDVFAPEHLGMIGFLWPILVIGVGVDLLAGRRSLIGGAVVGVVTVGLIVIFMALGPSFGWTQKAELRTDTFGEVVGAATTAQVSIETAGYSADLHALPASSAPERPLVNANVTYRGAVEFLASGETDKVVTIASKGERWWWHFLDLGNTPPWDIGLDPAVPVSLSVDTSSGSDDLDLSGVQLTGLDVSMSSGDVKATLPAFLDRTYTAALQVSSGDMQIETATGARIEMSLDMSSGDVHVTLGADSDVTVRFNGSSGQFSLDLAPGQAYRVEVRSVSSGDVSVPSGLVQVTQGDGDEGTWETQGYADAPHKVLVVVEHLSSGDVDIIAGR